MNILCDCDSYWKYLFCWLRTTLNKKHRVEDILQENRIMVHMKSYESVSVAQDGKSYRIL